MAQTGPPRTDIRMVAARARVSIATVSRVMNQVASVNPKLAARVAKAVAELGYTPDTQARSLVSGRSRMLGLIVTLITNPFYPELVQSFEDLAAERGYDVLVGSTNYLPKRKLACVRRMVERKVEGVAMMTFGSDEELLRSLAQHRFPIVSIGPSHVPNVRPIAIDFGCGVHEAVQHLTVLGHRRLAFISGPLRVSNSLERQSAFLEAARSAGLRVPANYLCEGDHTMESGFEGAGRLLALRTRPTAILCSNDLTAIGVLHAASAMKLKVPGDVSVVGFDDIHMAEFTVPPLTTVRMSRNEIARAALDSLLAVIEGHAVGDAETIPTRLVVRQSTGYPPATSSSRQISRPQSRASGHPSRA